MVRNRRRSHFAGKVAYNAERTQQASTQYGYLNLSGGVSIFKDSGTYTIIDILPYQVTDEHHPDRDDERGIALPGELWYKRPFKAHRNIGSANAAVVCLSSFGKKCPVCEHRSIQIKEGAPKEATDALKPSRRNLYVVVPKHSKNNPKTNQDYKEEPHVWDVSQFLFQNLLTEELKENSDNEIFPDLEDGLTLRLRFTESQIGKNTFSEVTRIDFEQRDQSYDESILGQVPKLDELLIELSYKDLERKFQELDGEPNGGETAADQARPMTRHQTPEARSSESSAGKQDGGDDIPEPDGVGTARMAAEDACMSCEGTGRNSKGKTCLPCGGSGLQQLPIDDGKLASPSGQQKQRRNPSPQQVHNGQMLRTKCPHGHKFGIDAEGFDECDKCDKWSACIDEKEKSAIGN